MSVESSFNSPEFLAVVLPFPPQISTWFIIEVKLLRNFDSGNSLTVVFSYIIHFQLKTLSLGSRNLGSN